MAISVLDAFADAGATGNVGGVVDPGSFTVTGSAGDDRLLIYIQYYEGGTSGAAVTGVAYGGQAMEQIVNAATDAGNDADVRVWVLRDADIELASNSDFSLTGTPGASGDGYRAYAGTIQGAHQGTAAEMVADTLVRLDSAEIPVGADIDTVTDGIVIGGGLNTGAAGTHVWSGITTRLTDTTVISRSLAYDLTASDSTITTSLDIGAGGGGRAYALASINPVDPIVEADASTPAAASNGSANATRIRSGAASTPAAISGGSADVDPPDTASTPAAVSGGSADATRIRSGSASTPAADSSGLADATRTRQGSASTPEAESDGSAIGTRRKPGTASTPSATSDGSADATTFSGSLASTPIAVSGGSAFADPPIPLIPELPLEDAFFQSQRPVILIDMFFDREEINIWTRPVTGTFAQKTYQPLAGITGGLTFRNSLEDGAIESSIQLSGQSQEILNIALTEQFQNRRIEIILGNLDENFEVESVETILPGVITNMPVTDDAESSEVSIVVESVFRAINQTEAFRLSSGDQKVRHPNDTFFDFIETTGINTPAFGDS